MGYEVIHSFADLQDFNHVYKVGDLFPRLGVKVAQSRIDELASTRNKRGIALIKLVGATENKVVNEPVKVAYSKREISRMAVNDLRELAKSEGIEGVEDMAGAKLKEILIAKYGL